MGRSLKKGPYVAHHVLAKVEKQKADGSSRPIKTWSRNSVILPEMIGCTFEVHNGKKFIAVFVSENMVGHKLGEFSPTRTFRSHGSKKAAEAAGGGGTGNGGAAAAPVAAPAAAAPAKKG